VLRRTSLLGLSFAQLTLALILLLVGWATPAHAGPTPAASSSDSDGTALVIVTGSGPVVVVLCNARHSAWANVYAYCGGDPVNRSDPSGLDWEWISGDDSTYLRGTDIKLWNNANGYWSFVPGSDPAVPRPLVSLDKLESRSPTVPIGASGNPTVDLNYFTANASVIDPRFDANYDRAPYIRDNAVYNAVVDGLARQMGVAGMPAAAQLEALSKINAIGVRASWVRGRAQTSTMTYLDSSFWAQGGGALDQLQAQTANAAMLYGLTTITGAAGDLALMEAGGGALQSLIAARNLQRILASQAAAGRAGAAAADKWVQVQTPPAVARIGGGIPDRFSGGTFRAGFYDPRTNELLLGPGGHFNGPANAGFAGNPLGSVTPGITTVETNSILYWANDSQSLNRALSASQSAAVRKALERAFPGKAIKLLESINDVPAAIAR